MTPEVSRDRTTHSGRLASSSPPRRDLAILLVAVVCASSAPPLMAAIAAPALAIAFWRNAMALPVVLPMAWWHERGARHQISPAVLGLVLFAAAMLGLHFTAMATALDRTSVASAATLVCSQSVWAAVFAGFLGERLGVRGWVGTAVALSAVVLVTGAGSSLGQDSLSGNLLALLSGVAGGAYMVTGGVVRQRLGTSLYTAICYGACAAMLLVVLLVTGTPVIGFSARTWLLLAALTLSAQLLGHSLFNLVMRSVSPSLVSVSQLLTVPLAALAAAVLLDQETSPTVVPALALMALGIGLVVSSHRQGAIVDEGP